MPFSWYTPSSKYFHGSPYYNVPGGLAVRCPITTFSSRPISFHVSFFLSLYSALEGLFMFSLMFSSRYFVLWSGVSIQPGLLVLFCGGWLAPFWLDLNIPFVGAFWFGIKTCFFLFVYIWVRASLPRYLYDQLMRLSLKFFLPLSVGYVILTAGILFGFDGCFSGSAM